VQALNAAGHEIGSHTSTHAHLPGLPESDLRNEVAGSREEFAILGLDEPATFAYPYGEFDEFARSAVAASGYSAARGVDRGYNTPGSDPYNLQIYQVDAGTSLADVQNWVDEASANDDWLILMFHQVDYSGDAYGTTPEVLQGIADYLNENQVSVATVESGASLLF
jgi:peptidoglycan/xylan/chitin deacetylase (PgdA/CDA1 family)